MEFDFQKEHRLLTFRDIRATMDQGRKKVSPLMVTFRQANDQNNACLGIVVSKKIGNAVVRNRVKRTLRESFRHMKNKLSGFNLVVIARKDIAAASYREIDQAFSSSFAVRPMLNVE